MPTCYPIRAAVALAAFLTAVSPLPSVADVPVTYTHDGARLFTIDVPDFWDVRTGGERNLSDPETGLSGPVTRVLSLRPTVESGVWIGFIVPEGVTNMQQAADYLQELGQYLSLDIALSAPEQRSVGGLRAFRADGLGVRDGKDVQLTLSVIDLPGRNVAIAAVLTEVGIDASWYPLINDIFGSFRVGG